MLHQSTDGRRHHLAIMRFAFRMGFVAVQLLGPIGDGGRRHGDACLFQTVAQGRVIVIRNGELRVVHQFLLSQQLFLIAASTLADNPAGVSRS